MTKRRKLVKELLDAGFVSKGGRNHEVFVNRGSGRRYLGTAR